MSRCVICKCMFECVCGTLGLYNTTMNIEYANMYMCVKKQN